MVKKTSISVDTHLTNLKKKKFRKYQKASSRRPFMPEGQQQKAICVRRPPMLEGQNRKVTYISQYSHYTRRSPILEGQYQKAIYTRKQQQKATCMPEGQHQQDYHSSIFYIKKTFFHPLKKYKYSLLETKFCGTSVKVPQNSTQFPPTNFPHNFHPQISTQFPSSSISKMCYPFQTSK